MERLSIVIPCFDEEKNLPKLFSALERYIVSQKLFELEVVFVDDGSSDQTLSLIERFVSKYPQLLRVISYKENKGKGFAVRKGMIEAKGDWRLLLDADLAVSLDQIEKIRPYIEKGGDVVIGSRVLPSSQIILPQNIIRQSFGKVFTKLANVATGLKVSDFTCGFKCFSAEATQKIFGTAKIDRWAYDAEVLYLARRYNFDIHEVGVVWRNGSNSKVKVVVDTVRAFVDLIRIRLIYRKIWK